MGMKCKHVQKALAFLPPSLGNVESKHGEINASHNDEARGAGQSISEMSVALLLAYTTTGEAFRVSGANIYLMYPNAR